MSQIAIVDGRYQIYSACLSRFFGIQPLSGETIATDGKVLRGSYEAINDDPEMDSHPAIMLVTTYIVERGLILEPYEAESKTNEITALPAFIQQMALKGVVFAFDAISTQKTAQLILDSGNDYLGALLRQPIHVLRVRRSLLPTSVERPTDQQRAWSHRN